MDTTKTTKSTEPMTACTIRNDFPGYRYSIDPIPLEEYSNPPEKEKKPHSIYMGDYPSDGGYVYAEPGMYVDVKVFDAASLHPSSIIALNKFGKYTEKYKEIKDARILIKHHELDKAKELADGKLAKYLKSDKEADKLAKALKLILNSTYGYCWASFETPFRDSRDKDNIVAKRGALFMIQLKHKLQDAGYTVISVKTDSVKVVQPDKGTEKIITDLAKEYGYEFEVEDEFERICLVNVSTFIARTVDGKWEAKAAQFAHPYVFKTLFTHEELTFEDFCETKEVKSGTTIYLDKNERLGEDDHDYQFIGRIGRFCPIIEGAGGARLVKSSDGTKYDYVTGAKGYRWLEAEYVKAMNLQDKIDMSYFETLADKAIKNISQYGDFDIFVNADHDMYKSYIDSLRDPAFSTYMQSPIEVVKEDEEVPF